MDHASCWLHSRRCPCGGFGVWVVWFPIRASAIRKSVSRQVSGLGLGYSLSLVCSCSSAHGCCCWVNILQGFSSGSGTEKTNALSPEGGFSGFSSDWLSGFWLLINGICFVFALVGRAYVITPVISPIIVAMGRVGPAHSSSFILNLSR
jgi:hypothetical protein